MKRRAFAKAMLLAPAAPAVVAGAYAQDYPSRTIQLVVGFPAGQSSDVSARLLAKGMSEDLKQAIYVDNKPGATGIIAHQFIKNAPPDGYTLLYGSTATLAINPTLYRKLPYDPLKDFAPIALLYGSPIFLVAAPELPIETLTDAVAYIKARPGKLTYGSGGSGSTQHIAMELLKKELGLDLMHVPYKGTPAMLNDLLAGRVDFAFEAAAAIVPYIDSKKVKVLAVSTAHRLPGLPEVPTVAEQGLPGFEALTWGAVVTPAGTPAPIVERLNEAANRAQMTKEMQAQYARTFSVPRSGPPSLLANFMRDEIAKWGKAVIASGAQVD